MKRRRLPVKVERSKSGALGKLCWKGHWSPVERQVNAWVIQGQWWSNEVRRHYIQLVTSNGVVEVYRDGDGWWLSSVLD